MWRALVLLAVLAVALPWESETPAHAATPGSYVALFSDDEWVLGGVHRLYHSGNASIRLNGTPASLEVEIEVKPSGGHFFLRFAAPRGESLVAGGVYVDAERLGFRSAGHPGIDISGLGRGCNTVEGHFEVKDLGVSSTGAITRLWILYTQYCEGGTRALWGEARVGLPTSTAPLVAPGIVRWPAGDVSRPGNVVPVTLVGGEAPLAIGAAAITGAAADEFSIRTNECSGKVLTLQSSCQIWVRFAPGKAGTKTAALHVTDGAGVVHEVRLQAFAHGGATRLEMTSEPGDYIGQGRTWSYVVATSEFHLDGRLGWARFLLAGADDANWDGHFTAGGAPLVVGQTYTDGFAVTGDGRACDGITGTFTVTAADFAPDGRLRSAGISFEQRCHSATAKLRGRWEFRAGDNTPLAPWLIGHAAPAPPEVTMFAPSSGAPGTSVTIEGHDLRGATAVSFGGVKARFIVWSPAQLQAIVPHGAGSGPIVVTTAGGAASSPTTYVVSALPPMPPWGLIGNGSFEADLSGWTTWEASATQIAGGAVASYAARVSLWGSASRYRFMTSPWPVSPTRAGATYHADALVRGQIAGRRICLVLREWGIGQALVRDARSCVAASGGWQEFPPLRYRTQTSGGSLELFVEQSGAEPGDSFDLDSVLLCTAETGALATGSGGRPCPDGAGQGSAGTPGAGDAQPGLPRIRLWSAAKLL